MTAADIMFEFRQLLAAREEEKTGKPYDESDVTIDENYDDWLASATQ